MRQWMMRALALVTGVIVAGALGIPLAPAGASSSQPTAPATGFGGYAEHHRRVVEVGARWKVASVSARSPAGTAATWIGAESSRDGSSFFQVGDVTFVPTSGPVQYWLFWSDAAVGFHAQLLGRVRPDDDLSVEMHRVASGWRLRIADRTAHTRVQRTIAYAPQAAYDVAEWIEEDPATGYVSASDVPYPRLSTVQFRALRLDGRSPHLVRENGTTLITNGDGVFVPTPVRRDGFVLVRPTGAARRYLVDVRVLDHWTSEYQAALVNWSAMPLAARVRLVRGLVKAFRRAATMLAHDQWPALALPTVLHLVRRERTIAVALVRWRASGLSLAGSNFANVNKMLSTSMGDAVRSAIGLPPP